MDKYDKAIEYLTQHPGEIDSAWTSPFRHKGGCLFTLAATKEALNERWFGCLTTIRGHGDTAETRELTEAIQADERIPKFSRDIKIEHLPVFAEWQRRIDKELNRVD